MKKITFTIVLIIIGAVGLYAFQLPPVVNVFPSLPSTIYVNTPTQVTITAQIPDSRVIPTGVNLLQVDPITGQTSIIGTLQGPGQSFSVVIQPSTSAPQLFTYQISAAFKGLLRRSLSLPITVAVAPAGIVLPPDPGPAGMQILAGIDSDGDGVRDDIQRWIAVTQPASMRIRMALTQDARGIQQMILSGGTKSQALGASDQEGAGFFCLAGIMGSVLPAGALTDQLHSIALNTAARLAAYMNADALTNGTGSALPDLGARTSLCEVNPTTLPN